VAAAPALNLTPRSLEIDEAELRNLQKLGPLLSSPRAVKRLVNLYRIARAGLDEDSIDAFVRGGRFRLTQLFLAAVVGAPKAAAILCDAIFDGRISGPSQLTGFLEQRKELNDAWRALDAAFAGETLLHDWTAVTDAARSVARFSFQTGRVLQDAADSPRLPKASPGTPKRRRSGTPPPS
jgi:hypothetical protein